MCKDDIYYIQSARIIYLIFCLTEIDEDIDVQIKNTKERSCDLGSAPANSLDDSQNSSKFPVFCM